jgi:hypothetical protein
LITVASLNNLQEPLLVLDALFVVLYCWQITHTLDVAEDGVIDAVNPVSVNVVDAIVVWVL